MKTANVNVRVEENIKEQAESILDKLGISVSTFINMTYRQVIMRNGLPFEISLPKRFPVRDNLNVEEFDSIMSSGLEQAKNGDSVHLEDAFDSL